MSSQLLLNPNPHKQLVKSKLEIATSDKSFFHITANSNYLKTPMWFQPEPFKHIKTGRYAKKNNMQNLIYILLCIFVNNWGL